MKVFIAVLVLIFSLQSITKADDIRDFEIEGMSIGDSLLDYMLEEEIKKNVGFVYEDKKFTVSVYNKSSEMYDMIGIEYKSKDKKYKIHGVQGLIDFPNNIKSCYKKQDEIEKEISTIFTGTKKNKWDILKNKSRAEGSTYKPITFDLNNGRVAIECYHYSDKPQDDHLKISTGSKELIEYIDYITSQY